MVRRQLLVCLLLGSLCYGAIADMGTLPRPPELQPAVDFWTRIYSQVTTHEGLLHDRDNLAVVYESLEFDVNLWHPDRDRKIDARRDHYRDILLSLASGKRTNLSADEKKVLALWPEGVSNTRLQRAASSIRFQLGQADRFKRGLIRSGAWEPHMREQMAAMGLPPQIAALPHVESSFNPDAYSRVGAAGIWQFTRLTGRRFMRVDHIIDERMDPFTATEAAGRLLKLNYSITEDWGMALTAYNHGLAGIRRAARTVGSKNIADIIERYEGRNWGFASRNFYPAFLAAVEVDENAERYFGKLDLHPPLNTATVEMPFFAPVDAVMEAVQISRDTLKQLNRGLLDPIWNGDKYIPRGYALRLPAEMAGTALARLQAMPENQRYYAQVPDLFHTVQRGETLSDIARRYGTSVRSLTALNNMRSAHLIRAGQKLRLPVDGAQISQRETYTVRSGDTLSGIAQRVNMDTSDLAAANGIDPDKPLRVGEVLRVDGKPAEAPTVASTVTAPAEEPAPVVFNPAAVAWPLAPGEPEPSMVLAGEPVTTLSNMIMDQMAPVDEQPGVSPQETASAFTASVGDGTGARVSVDLSADPSDYTVADNRTIEIQAMETLGHYAEWLDIRAADLRRLNNMRYGEPLVIGHRLKLSFANVSPATFERRRKDHHIDIQSDFFARYHIEGTRTHTVKWGDSLWTLTRPNTNIPVWLLRQYNPDKNFDVLMPETTLQIPVIKEQ
jgi:membrane-bound lytic murein transglycosylase D